VSINETLAAALLQAVREQGFGAESAARGEAFPSLDLAVVRFAPGSAPAWANVLFSREHPQGVVARIGADAAAVRNIRFDRDLQDARGDSAAWLPGADWSALPWQPLWGDGPHRFVAPYPASLLKLVVAVGVGLAVDAGRCAWPDDDVEPMIVVSDNEATDRCVALLHRVGMIDALNTRLQALGLHTLQLNDTKPDGGWRNADGAGVGHIHMTAWDTVRLLWLLDRDAPPAPWLAPGTTLLQPASREHLRGVLRRQQIHDILSSPGGVPAAPAFAHKTGNTDNYASDAGIVLTEQTHYLVALLTSLGKRHARHPGGATSPKVPALGAAVHTLMVSPP
jgi:Beta-lactamase enzyme family